MVPKNIWSQKIFSLKKDFLSEKILGLNLLDSFLGWTRDIQNFEKPNIFGTKEYFRLKQRSYQIGV